MTARSTEAGCGLAAALALVLVLAGTAAAATPAERRIDRAEQRLEAHPRDPDAHRALATALTQRARETADAADYERALGVLARARELLPREETRTRRAQLDALEAWIRLGRHEFARAETLARRAVQARPDDPASHGVLGDALMEQGIYAEAASAYQRMLTLRPGPASFVRAAYYLQVTGELDRARELLDAAFEATPDHESEERAWILASIAAVESDAGRLGRADALYADALRSFPGYAYALAGRARVALRRGEGRTAEALARQALESTPHPEYRLLLADALRGLGRIAEARAQEDQFEREALEHIHDPDNENHFLVDYLLDRRPDPEQALEVARTEASRRRDIHTVSRLARALARTGHPDQARALMQEVLAVGTRDPEILGQAREVIPDLP